MAPTAHSVTEQQARHTANVVMAAAVLGTAVFVLRSPHLRRLAWRFAREFATGPLAAWGAGTVRTAWDDAGDRRPGPVPGPVPGPPQAR